LDIFYDDASMDEINDFYHAKDGYDDDDDDFKGFFSSNFLMFSTKLEYFFSFYPFSPHNFSHPQKEVG
jgi:hypothetical protein